MVTRRRFISTTAMAGAAGLVPWKKLIRQAYAQIPGGTLAPGDVRKFELPLIKPPAMPKTARIRSKGRVVDYYEIAVREFSQRILTPGTGTQSLPETKVWSYASKVNPNPVVGGGTLNYPAFTIEASYGIPVRVAWRNELMNGNGGYLPHLFDVDPTLHWANPPGGNAGRDSMPTFPSTPGPYMGPVPIVTHVHGAHTFQESDGYPEAWYLPPANDIPVGYAEKGTFYDTFMDSSPLGGEWGRGRAVFEYPNDQRATTLWYHDHTLGMTRLNVYAGPAGFYLIRGGADDRVRGTLPGPAPGVGDDPLGEYFEIPIVIQDRSFNNEEEGSLFYPSGRAFFDDYEGPFIPDTPVPPIWNPEFFGNMMVVNGYTWPYLDVKKQRYRFRLLNGCNSRFLILKFSDPNVKVWQIGAEGGFLPEPVNMNAVNGGQILMAPAERADVIVDFAEASGYVQLLNFGPDEPFKGFNADGTLADGGGEGGALPPADPDSTGQVMEFHVQGGALMDPSTPPEQIRLPRFNPLGDPTANPRYVDLHEEVYEAADIPVAALLGSNGGALKWSDAPTETPNVGDTEIWEITNLTEDAHPIHIHLVQFQVVGRGIDGTQGPEPWEAGYKDTVIAYPGEITRVKARFDIPGLFVWHCHIVEHEDNEMMRPYTVGGPVGGV